MNAQLAVVYIAFMQKLWIPRSRSRQEEPTENVGGVACMATNTGALPSNDRMQFLRSSGRETRYQSNLDKGNTWILTPPAFYGTRWIYAFC